MKISVKFNINKEADFAKELRLRVNNYFKDNNISKKADLSMKIKTVFMILLYFVPFALMLTGVVSSLWLVLLMWFLMGFGMSGIGLSIMHDANHGSYSSNKNVNNILGFLLNFAGGYHKNWKIQHNVLHHSYTNVEGYDQDIANPVMRFSPSVKLRKLHRFQAYYASFFYGIMTLYWFLAKDFIQLYDYHKKDLLSTQNLTFGKALFFILFHKLWYAALTLILPIILSDLPWWQVVIGFSLMEFICGLMLAYIFQPAHVIEETSFFLPDANGEIDSNPVVHQLRTTANFANNSIFFSWFIGGLNFQIEHHLFPNICHTHYKKLSPIVKQVALEYGFPYHSHKTFYGALSSHFSLLHKLGTGKI